MTLTVGHWRSLVLALFALIAAAPSAVAQDGGGRRIVFERFGYRLTRIGETVAANAGVLDASLLPEPNPQMTWRVDNPAVATVSPRGVVQARSVGYTRLWVVSGRDSAYVMVVVSGNQIHFAPNPLRFESAGGRLALRILFQDPAGKTLEDLARTRGVCRSMDEGVATLGGNGQVLSNRTGFTWVLCVNAGVRDSVRIEVGQRAVRVAITNGVARPMSVGDTMRVQARADNSSGERITSSSPSWVSRNPRVVNVDSATGLARAVGPGATILIARLNGIADSMPVTVQPPAGAVSLRLDPILPFVNDTVRVTATARNSAGAIVADSDLTAGIALRSSRPDVVAVIGDQRVVALRAGSAWIVATAGALTDSTAVAPRERTTSIVTQGTSVATTDSARAADLRPRSTVRIGGKIISLTATASRTTHSSRLAQGLTESRSGLLVGAAASAVPTPALVVAADFRTGTLAGSDAIGGDLALTEAAAQLTYWPREWLGLRGGYTRRSQGTDLVLHHWQFANVTAVTRFAFAGGALNAVSAVSLLPWGGFSGHMDAAGRRVAPNRTSFAAEAGIEYRTRWLSAALGYYGEKFTFPEVNGTSRQDKFSSLRLHVGVHAALSR